MLKKHSTTYLFHVAFIVFPWAPVSPPGASKRVREGTLLSKVKMLIIIIKKHYRIKTPC